jgi:glycine cleavage system H protein
MKSIPDDLLYSREHVWVRVEGDLATIGITDHAQEKLGEILSLDLPAADSYVERDEPFISVNEDITDEIGVINSDPHDTGWMIIVDLEDPEELDDLLDVRGYQEFVIQEAEVD